MRVSPDIPVLLRIAPRDIRASRGEALAQRRSLHARAAEFAQALLARFSPHAWSWTPPGLVFRQDRPLVAAHYVQQNSHTHFAPRLGLTVLTWQSGRRDDVSDKPSPPAARVRVDQETHMLRTLVHSVESSTLDRLVYRMVTQGQRVEANSRAAPASFAPGSLAKPAASTMAFLPVPEMPPVQKIVRRAVPAETESVASPRTMAGASGANYEAGRSTNARPQPPQPAIDVNQLTDQVIKAIDRRIIAQRERLGRV